MRQAVRLAVGVTITFLTLWASARPAAAQEITLGPFSNFTFNTPIGIDFHEPAGQLIMSVNYPTGLPNNLDLVAPGNAVPTQFSNLAGLTNELKLASVRNTNCTGGFLPGTVFTGNGEPGQLVRISFDGTVVDNPWITLHDNVKNFTEPALVRGSIFQDRFCVAGGDLIVVTGNEQEPAPDNNPAGLPQNFVGNVWRVTSTGVATLLLQLNKHMEGVSTVPNDPLHFGPLAGKIIAGDEDFVYLPNNPQPQNGPNGKIFAIDPNTGAFFTIGGGTGSGVACTGATGTPNGCHYRTAQPFHPEDLDLIRKNSQFFGVAFRDGLILTAGPTSFAARCGQILITQEFPFPGTSGLYALRWNPAGNNFIADLLTANFNVQQWEHVTFTTGEDCFVPRLVLTKTPKNATFNPGDTLTFNIVVRNAGDFEATGVTLTDPLPTTGGLTWAVNSVTPPTVPCNINASQVLTCNIGTLAAGASVTVALRSSNAAGAPVGACTGQKLNNVAQVTSTNAGTLQDTGDYICNTPSIRITKSPKNATFNIGDPLSFTIVVSSNGPGPAQNVTLSDPLPTTGGLTWAVTSVTPSGTCAINAAQQLSCTFGTLASGQTRTVVVTTNNAAGAPAGACTGQKLNNVATASATSLTPVQDTGDYTCQPPHIALVKTPNNRLFDIGEQLRFRLVVTSTGPGTAKNVVVSDPLPTIGGLTWTVVSVNPSGTCSINAAQILSCAFGDLAPTATRTVVVRTNNAGGVPAAACTGERINNLATATATGVPPVTDPGAYRCQTPSISITKSPKNATFNIGDPLSFTIVVSSNGPGTAQNVTLGDPLPTTGGLSWAVTSVTPAGTCSINAAQQLSCTFGSLASGATRTVVVTTNNAGGAPSGACTGRKLNNVATASATSLTPVQDTGDYTCQPPGISITKNPKNATFSVGDPLSFSIVVSSNGPGVAQNVSLSDPLPTTGGLTWAVTSVTPAGTCSINAAQQLSCTFGNLAAGASRTVVVTTNNAAGAPAGACIGQKLNNVATATANALTPVQDTGDYTCQPPSISITKNPKNATFLIGDQLTFSIVVSSNGPGTATNVTMTDPLPTTGGLTWAVTSVNPAGTCSINAAQQLSCSFGNLVTGASRTVVVTTNNTGGAPVAACTGEKLNNTATAVANGLSPVQDTGDYTCNPSLVCPVTDQPTDGTITVTTLPNGNFLVVYNQGRTLNDNSYGTGAVGWGGPGKHTFNNLVGSDHAEFIFKDANGQVVLDFALDYIGAKTGTPSGFASLGFGGDGDPVSVGNPAHVLAFETSLEVNLNGRAAGSPFGPAFQAFCNAGNCTVSGVNLLVNSPPTTGPDSYTLVDPATFGRWIFDDYYAVVIDKAAFGAAGFGSIQIGEVHNSPSKGSPGDTVECPSPPGDGGGACASGKKVQKIEMQYTGLTCANSSHNQAADKVKCTDAAALTSQVRIVASSKDGNRVWFDGTVNVNGNFVIDAGAAGKETLDSDTLVKIFNLQGTLLQTVQFHTSCSQPLDENDRFGSLNVVDLTLVNK